MTRSWAVLLVLLNPVVAFAVAQVSPWTLFPQTVPGFLALALLWWGIGTAMTLAEGFIWIMLRR